MSGFKHLPIGDAQSFITEHDPLVVDIRDPQSFALGHIDGAYPLSNENISDFLTEHSDNASRPLIVVCYHGISSQNAASYLNQQGFADVYSLDGGFSAWQQFYPDKVVSS